MSQFSVMSGSIAMVALDIVAKATLLLLAGLLVTAALKRA